MREFYRHIDGVVVRQPAIVLSRPAQTTLLSHVTKPGLSPRCMARAVRVNGGSHVPGAWETLNELMEWRIGNPPWRILTADCGLQGNGDHEMTW